MSGTTYIREPLACTEGERREFARLVRLGLRQRRPSDLDATRQLIAQQNKRFTEAGLTEFREETTDFYGNEEYVVDAGTYVVTYGPDHVTERGKYLNVWQQVNGSWKIKSNMWNTNAPTPPLN